MWGLILFKEVVWFFITTFYLIQLQQPRSEQMCYSYLSGAQSFKVVKEAFVTGLSIGTFFYPKQLQMAHRFWPKSWWAFEIATLMWWSNLNKTTKGSFFETPCSFICSDDHHLMTHSWANWISFTQYFLRDIYVWFLCRRVIALTWWGLLEAQKRFEYERIYFSILVDHFAEREKVCLPHFYFHVCTKEFLVSVKREW